MRASGSQFDGPGRVHIGANLPNSPSVAGHFILHDNAMCRLEGNFSILSGCRIDVYRGAALTLGSGYINVGGRLQCYSAITIGDGTFIGENFRAMDWDQHSIDGRDSAPQPIHIGASVWIGAGVTVLKGVTIGDGAVIGAGSIVTRDIGAHRLAVGIPAREVSDVSWRKTSIAGQAQSIRDGYSSH